jgi:hypothetical protein
MPNLQTIKDNPTDPIGVIIGTIATTLAGLGIPSKLGLTVDQFGMIAGAVFTIAATVRGLAIHKAKASK